MVRITRWRHEGVERGGFVHDGAVFALPGRDPVNDLLEAGLSATLRIADNTLGAAAGHHLADVDLLPPLQPRSIRDFVTFEEHVEGIVRRMSDQAVVVDEWYQAPTFYFTNPHTVRATDEQIGIPAGCQELDYEAEVGIVIGRMPGSSGTNLDYDDAQAHIFGLTVLNDWSARDLQLREMRVGLGPCKGKDFATTLGPWIVTADEFAPRFTDDGFLPLAMRVRVNGHEYGSDLLSNMGWPLSDLVRYASADSRVVPGDVLGTGTCGRGCLAELWGRKGDLTPPPLVPGDVVEVEVEGIGTIRNSIGPRREALTLVPARHRDRTRPRAQR
ncbi:fumarylacetoacetate hydrolase family protein [Promicromonospora sp. NPDC057138]|uniref:fumarylacetoacetate hydrolase family protein n=1 Tax=Promicromonospora sp. NPDC057138 TaxID=3346031 RepID=UPI00362B65B4